MQPPVPQEKQLGLLRAELRDALSELKWERTRRIRLEGENGELKRELAIAERAARRAIPVPKCKLW